MYDNIGGKIKRLARISFVIEMLAAIVVGAILWYDTEEWWCALIVFGGPIVAWVSSWTLYGFGEIIDKLCDIEENTRSGIFDKHIQYMTPSITKGNEENNNSEAEERAKREAEERAKREAEEKTKLEAAKQAKKQDPLSEKLTYALRFQTDDGMIRCLKDIDDPSVQNILKSPTPLIRKQITELLEQLQ